MRSRSLVLVSASPRRSDLLRLAGLDFTVRPVDIDETPRPYEDAASLAERLAETKVRALPAPAGAALAIGADTVVAVKGTLLGKPRDPEDARRMLRLLAGRTHDVITAVALRLIPEETIESERCVSRVRFAAMSSGDVDWYVATGEGMDKAGAYALQGKGALFVESVDGSYTNVIGLPLDRLYPHLRRHGLIPGPSPRS